MKINRLLFVASMILVVNACKEEELIFPPQTDQETVVTETRPAAKPSNLNLVSAFNKSVEIYWPAVSDRVAKAEVTYKEGDEIKKVAVTNFDEPTILYLEETAVYNFGMQYFTSDGTPSKVASAAVRPRPFEADYKMDNILVQPAEEGVFFIFPKTSERAIPGKISYEIDGKVSERMLNTNIEDTIRIGGLTDVTKEINFKIQLKDDLWKRDLSIQEAETPGVLVYKLVVPTLKVAMEGNNAAIQWTNSTGTPIDVKVTYQGADTEIQESVSKDTDLNGKLSFDVGGKPGMLKVSVVSEGGTSPVQTFALYAPIPRTTWSAEVSSTEANEGAANGKASSLIDGDINTYWHSTWSSSDNPVYPHWFIINFGKVENFAKFGMIRRHNNTTGGFKTFDVEVSLDGTAWTKVATDLIFKSDDNPAAWQDFVLPTVKTQYVRIMIKTPMYTSSSTHLAEFRAFSL